MRNRLLLTLLFLCIITTSSFVPTVMAADAQFSGKVIDSSGAPVTGSNLRVTNAATHKEVGNFPTDIAGNYRVQVPQGVYDITVIPPAGSGLSQTSQSHVDVSGNTVKDISLPSVSKSPAPGKNVNNLVPNIIIAEIIIVILIILGYILWRRKHR
ncbi:MAG: carboxypeptidase-like regulatory domain-containing protein [Candidatus Levyibacteriota bacterium]